MHAWLTVFLNLSTTSSLLQSFAMQVAKFTTTALAARSSQRGDNPLRVEDPKNWLRRIKIIDNGLITDLKIRNNDTSGETPAISPVVEANSLYECNNTYQLINFYHATLNYPVISMLVKVIDKCYLKGFASLTSCQVCQHNKVNNEAEKDHMDQSCQGTRSKKASSPAWVPPPFSPHGKLIDTMEPLPQKSFNACTHFVFMTIIEISGMLFSNQLSWFPITSNRGNKYVVIFYIYKFYLCQIRPHQKPVKGGAPAGLPVGICLPHSTGF